MVYVANEIVWAIWDKQWHPCMIIDQEIGVFQKVDIRPKEHEEDVLWLGHGTVSRVPTDHASMRDFCKCFKTCYPDLNLDFEYKRAVEMCVKLVASESQIPMVSDWETWANEHITSCEKLVLPECFYQALKEKHQIYWLTSVYSNSGNLKKGKKSKKSKKSNNSLPLSCLAPHPTQMQLYFDEILEKKVDFCVDSAEYENIHEECPIGWVAWYASSIHRAMLPCIVLDHNRFPGYKNQDPGTIFITSFVKECGIYRKFKVLKDNLLDFCTSFNSVHEDEILINSQHYKLAITSALQMIAQHANISEDKFKSQECITEWARVNLDAIGPLVLNECQIESFYKKV